MATRRMLIDASHPEETRVVVLDGIKLEEYDVEVATRRQLKGNIYLAKITRVEPSLQAAFVEYGGNRHGFLAFSEIHPDYYQIPVADREALIAEQAAAERAVDSLASEPPEEAEGDVALGGDDDEIERPRYRSSSRHYKIQEVVKRRQIMLVQVVKEERGNKGAALTSYLSLAGRYCVLMPNTSRGGGISRKISNVVDRKRLKKIVGELDIPEGMAVIVRTAGAGRSKAEIKRDYEYLLRMWTNIRELTLKSMAPALVYEEASLIKRSIRDLYGRDIEEIVIQSEPEYRVAKEFMRLFIPSHAKRVKLYEGTEKPLFHFYNVEDQLDAMHHMVVQLKSGGYIVINPTEALVSIDVNSGRATRERHIEETALRTNMEAADEIARQLRLRDLAGLIVIDFIDMENARNQGMVERRLKEAMKNDRARVQLGRISNFGLLELSRQRLRPSLLETSFEVCPHCAGVGLRRTTESTALTILRRIEDEGIKHRSSEVMVTVPMTVALYLLNHKRRALSLIEERYGFAVRMTGDESLVPPDYRIERTKAAPVPAEDEDVAAQPERPATQETAAADDKDEGVKRSRRRRPRRKKRPAEERELLPEAEARLDAEVQPGVEADAAEPAETGDDRDDEEEAAVDTGSEAGAVLVGDEEGEDPSRKRRRRGRRGGRRRTRRPADAAAPEVAGEDTAVPVDDGERDEDFSAFAASAGEDGEYAPTPSESEPAAEPSEPGQEETTAVAAKAPARRRRSRPAPRVVEAETLDSLIAEPSDDSEGVVASSSPATDEGSPGEGPADAEPIADTPPPAPEPEDQESGDTVLDTQVEAEPLLGEPAGMNAAAADQARRTEVIHVGTDEERALRDSPRRGWWQRFLD